MKESRMTKEVRDALKQADWEFEQVQKGIIPPGVKVVVVPGPPSPKEIKRVRKVVLKASLEEFSRVVGEGESAVKMWEAGLRTPNGAAAKIIRLLRERPGLAKLLMRV